MWVLADLFDCNTPNKNQAEVERCGYEARDIDERCAGCVLQHSDKGGEDESDGNLN